MVVTVKDAEVKLNSILDHLKTELKKLRTGRASVSVLDGVKVVVYGQQMPIQHIATLTVLDAQMIQISPFDVGNLAAISSAIRDNQALGLNPADDGKVIRIPIPPMTQERRLEVVKQLKGKLEDANVSVRNLRHDVLNALKAQLKDKEIGEDDERRVQKELTDILDKFKMDSEQMIKDKETEIMLV